MINPAIIVNSLVDLLRHIPDLVAELGGDEQRIYAYHDRYPKNISLEMAKYQMPAPGIMVVLQGTGVGKRGDFNAWKHDFSIFLRAAEDTGEDLPKGYYEIYRLMMKGIPSNGDGQALEYAVVNSSCEPMDDVPPIRRQTDSAGIDFFEVQMTFTEIGDD